MSLKGPLKRESRSMFLISVNRLISHMNGEFCDNSSTFNSPEIFRYV